MSLNIVFVRSSKVERACSIHDVNFILLALTIHSQKCVYFLGMRTVNKETKISDNDKISKYNFSTDIFPEAKMCRPPRVQRPVEKLWHRQRQPEKFDFSTQKSDLALIAGSCLGWIQNSANNKIDYHCHFLFISGYGARWAAGRYL